MKKDGRTLVRGSSGAPRNGIDGEVKSAARTIEILELLASESQPLTLTAIAARLPMPISSLHQLLKTLVARGWLDTPTPGGYIIGVRALLIGMSFIERDPVVRAMGPLLTALRSELGETVHLARLDGSHIVYLASRESEHQLRSVSRVGQSLSAHATALGRAALATLDDAEIRRLFPGPLERLTDHTICDTEDLVRDIERIRARGWAYEREENTLETGCVAVAIPGLYPPYATSCSVPLTRLTPERAEVIAGALRAAVRALGNSPRFWSLM